MHKLAQLKEGRSKRSCASFLLIVVLHLTKSCSLHMLSDKALVKQQQAAGRDLPHISNVYLMLPGTAWYKQGKLCCRGQGWKAGAEHTCGCSGCFWKGSAAQFLLGQRYVDSQFLAQIETRMHLQCKIMEWNVGAGRKTEINQVQWFVIVLS